MQQFVSYLPHVLLLVGCLVIFKPEVLYISENSEKSILRTLYNNRSIVGSLVLVVAFYLYKNGNVITNKVVSESVSSEASSVVSVPSYRDSVTETSVSLTK